MPHIRSPNFNEDYSKTTILFQDANECAIEILITSEDGPNGKEWVLESVKKS